jgi:hypothetical protein
VRALESAATLAPYTYAQIAFAVLGKLADGLLVVVTRPLLTWQDVGRDRL